MQNNSKSCNYEHFTAPPPLLPKNPGTTVYGSNNIATLLEIFIVYLQLWMLLFPKYSHCFGPGINLILFQCDSFKYRINQRHLVYEIVPPVATRSLFSFYQYPGRHRQWERFMDIFLGQTTVWRLRARFLILWLSPPNILNKQWTGSSFSQTSRRKMSLLSLS